LAAIADDGMALQRTSISAGPTLPFRIVQVPGACASTQRTSSISLSLEIPSTPILTRVLMLVVAADTAS
jgi:hypothetical protein